MKLPKFLLFISSLTLFSLFYVHQQTEIFRLAYDGQKRGLVFEDLLDKNTFLRYNIEKGASLTRIGGKVSDSLDFQMPDTYRLITLAKPLKNPGIAHYGPKKETLFARIFGIKAEAQARTISP